jgi:hypothetical protein
MPNYIVTDDAPDSNKNHVTASMWFVTAASEDKAVEKIAARHKQEGDNQMYVMDAAALDPFVATVAPAATATPGLVTP